MESASSVEASSVDVATNDMFPSSYPLSCHIALL
jgi:hypothetical protein